MGGKYEIRYYLDKEESLFETLYLNNWFEFMKLRFTKNVIYYKVNYFKRSENNQNDHKQRKLYPTSNG